MKFKLFLSLILCASLTCMAQGYKDGIEYYKVGQYDNAKELLLRNIDDPSTNKAEAYFYLGCIGLYTDNYEEAEKNFDAGIAADPEYGYNYVGMGELELRRGKLSTDKDAAKNAEKAAKKLFDEGKDLCGKKDDAVMVAIARAYYNVDPVKYADEIEDAKKDAKKRDKQSADLYVFEGDILADKQQWGSAASWYEMVMRSGKDNIEAYVKYANTYFYVNPAVAIQTLEDLVASKPNSALAQRELAEKYYKDDQWTKAAEKYGIYMQNPNHFKQDENRYAGLLFYGKRYQESYDLAAKIISEHAAGDADVFYMKRLQLYNLVAMAQEAENDSTAAAQLWNRADVLAKEFLSTNVPAGAKYEPKDYSDYAVVLAALGDIPGSVEMYKKAYDANPEKVDLLKNASDACTDAKDYENAAKFYQMYVDKADYKTNDLFVLSGRYLNWGVTTPDTTATDSIEREEAFKKALEYAEKVDSIVPNDLRILSRIANIHVGHESGFSGRDYARYGEAMPTYDAILAILDADPKYKDPNNADNEIAMYIEIFRYKAVHYYLNKDQENMKLYYQKWLEVDPTNDALRQYIETLK